MTDGHAAGAATIEARLAASGLPPLARLAWLEVDLGILAQNARLLAGLLPAGASLAVVVKADGYGHGLVASARAALTGGATILVVATLDEAFALRAAGIGARVLVLFPVPADMVSTAIDADLDLVVLDEASLEAMATAVRTRARHPAAGRRPARVHLGLDTGLCRGGIVPERAADAARVLLRSGLGALAGTWSHLATPESPSSVAAQVARFEAGLASLALAGIEPGLRNLDATGGLMGGIGPAYDMVRVGLGFYGILPPELQPDSNTSAIADVMTRLRPALSLHARAVSVAAVPAGTGVGYGGTWTADRPSVIATLPVGYADGWSRSLATGSWAMVRGRRVPVIGRISSDALALDVSEVVDLDPTDEFILLGTEAPAMTVHDLATRRDTIAWEVLDALSPRLARVYMQDGLPVGIRSLDGIDRSA